MRSELAHTLASIPPALCFPLRKQIVGYLQSDATYRVEKKRVTLILDNYIHSIYQSRAEDEHSSLQKVTSEALKQHVLPSSLGRKAPTASRWAASQSSTGSDPIPHVPEAAQQADEVRVARGAERGHQIR